MQSDLIRNGSFETPVNGTWIEYLDSNSKAVATFERTTSTAHDGNTSEHISVTASGQFYNAGLIQTAVPVTQGATYQFQFWAKSTNARRTQVALTMDGGDFHSYGLASTFTLGADWQLYTTTFQATESTADARLVFYFGDQPGDLWLDGVSLFPVAK